MTGYSTWEDYKELYGGHLARERYTRLAQRAALAIDAATNGAAATADESMAHRLCWCECCMADALADAEETAAGPGVKSVSSDGYAVSFESGGQGALRRALYNLAREYLTQPVNLLYRGAVVKHAGG